MAMSQVWKSSFADINLKYINNINHLPTIIIANEFFDAFPIKQFFKEKNNWYEKCIAFKNNNKKKITYYKNKINNITKINACQKNNPNEKSFINFSIV